MIPEIGRFNIFRAISLLGTTGKSLILLAIIVSIISLGLPAPVVTTDIFSSQITSKSCLIFLSSNIKLTPKGCEVRVFVFLIILLSSFAVRPPLPIIPKAPLFETAATNSALEAQAIPP